MTIKKVGFLYRNSMKDVICITNIQKFNKVILYTYYYLEHPDQLFTRWHTETSLWKKI